jgi:hypothetical protein
MDEGLAEQRSGTEAMIRFKEPGSFVIRFSRHNSTVGWPLVTFTYNSANERKMQHLPLSEIKEDSFMVAGQSHPTLAAVVETNRKVLQRPAMLHDEAVKLSQLSAPDDVALYNNNS